MGKKEKKVKKHDTFIDMTAMSDMTVLLLTFFMLTATFLPLEPVQVNAPGSVSPTMVPELNSMTILIDPSGKTYFNMSNVTTEEKEQKGEVLLRVGQQYGVPFTEKQVETFKNDVTHVGVPIKMMPAFLDMDASLRGEEIRKHGVPMDSTDNQLAMWVRVARSVGGKDMTLALKADRATEFPKVDKVMKLLVDIKEARYALVTSLRGMPEGF